MQPYRLRSVRGGPDQLEVPMRGAAIIADPLYNKGTGFSEEERRTLDLEGLLPAEVNTIERQSERIYSAIKKRSEPIEQFMMLRGLQDRNEHLYYRVLVDHLEEFLPVVYTPTVGQACRDYSRMFRRGRGLWITPAHRGRVVDVLRHAPVRDVRLIVATDNEAILGIGDQGAGGMAISVGKLSLYCAGAGIHPAETLAISLDVGTNNQELLDDPLYVGYRQPRITGEEYYTLLDEFVDAVRELFGGALIQWEDLRKGNALEVLTRYRSRTLSFNDDIQGTGAVALAALMTACRARGESLAAQRIVVFGVGAAGLGIARQLRAGLMDEGMTGDELIAAVALIDSRGLLHEDREGLDGYKRELAWPTRVIESLDLVAGAGLAEVVAKYRPTVLIGSSGQARSFSESIIRDMASHVDRPVVLPFSNPTDLSEALPQDIVRWTDGRALIATGSPFEPVVYGGREIHIGQGNNAFIFPGLGLGALLAGAREVSDGMISAVSRALSDQVTADDLETGLLFPPISRLRNVSASIAAATVRAAVSEGLCDPMPERDIAGDMWDPVYPELVPI